ncbi:TIM barrel protein [candidate division KSB1 bacterium]
MKIDEKSLARLEKDFSGYLEGGAIDEFFMEFDIKFAAGHWCAGDFSDRFASDGYFGEDEGIGSGIIDQMKRVAEAGIKGVEFHERVFLKNRFEKDPEVIAVVGEALSDFGLVPTNMNTNLWTDPKWKLGGITNPDKSIRLDALGIALQGIEIATEIGCGSVSLWPGSDGWDYNFEVNYGDRIDWFMEGCIEINRAAAKAGLGFGIEAKLHEPREGNMIIPTTQAAILASREVNAAVGGVNMGVAIDYGHEQMYAVEPAYSLYLARRSSVPVVNFHLNNSKLHSNDEDRIAATGDNWRLADFCYAAIDTGYDGWFGEDQFTYRTDPVRSMGLSRELFANIMKKALGIYARKDELLRAQASGDATRTIDVVKRFLV